MKLAATLAGLFAQPWKRDVLKACVIVALASSAGFLVNAFSARPVPIFAADGPGALPPHAPRMTAAALAQAWAAGEAVLLLDVRNDEAYRAEHPQDALHAPGEEFMQYYGEIAAQLQIADCIVVLCDSDECATGDRVAKLLGELKLPNVKVLAGGWPAYKASGLACASE